MSMTKTDKQALRQTAEKAQEHGVFNMDIHSETVLVLLDELEAKDAERKAADEPVAWMYDGERALPPPFILGSSDPSEYWKVEYQPLYTAPQAAPEVEAVVMKDHQIRELVNELRDIAVEYHGTHQLRERISRSVRAAMQQPVSNRDELGVMHDHEDVDLTQRECYQAGKARRLPDGWVACSERMPEVDGNYWGWWSESQRQGPVWFIKSDLQAQFQSSEITHWMPLPAAPC